VDARSALAELLELSPQLDSVVVAGRLGAVEAGTLPDAAAADVAASARDLLTRAELIADDHGREAVAQVQVQTETGAVFLVADERRLAVATTGAGATAGLVFYDLKSLLREIAGGPAADAVGAGGA
jgi:predicted regulator of Ras-like GTPase activity (Roadblock/LC7/MglB family)